MPNVQTPKFRVSYPNVFKAKHNDLNGKEEYSVVALFPKGTDLTGLKKAAQEALVEKFGADQKKWPKNLKTPFRKHEEKIIENDDGSKVYPQGMEEGGVFITLRSTQKPGVVNQKVEDILDAAEFYAGCWARATVSPYAYEIKGNAGVAFGLRNIQKLSDGDPLGSKTRAQDDFAPVDDAAPSSGSGGDATSLFN